jgi:hypothetical protein
MYKTSMVKFIYMKHHFQRERERESTINIFFHKNIKLMFFLNNNLDVSLLKKIKKILFRYIFN